MCDERNYLYFDFSSSCVIEFLVLVSHKNSLRLALSFDNKTDDGHICVAKLCKVVFSYFVHDACVWVCERVLAVMCAAHSLRTIMKSMVDCQMISNDC